ncbi:prepilin-type N-terminal cleavage/methylation domain-containing protein [Croceifilum oryzae]|uniref:Prepilin-type N-terminal cleavage/methylation domain-containing protein n=1 Tax=Croceifilum oryzae TaxID=1553429 RepID=A0AAJ1THZ9_9BACL|nr:competence type IV pilus major pilin ComGC [Croceifilum oryzae]MDQ0416299.1 prepilin-type N-terminal cleavage/methylation domain-containing protein [Croceifilum oryzae]
MKSKSRESGFTLVEMLVVLFVIGIILAIAIPNLRAAAESAKKKADQANRRMILTQAEQYYLEHGTYPKDVQVLVKDGYLQAAPTCPDGKGVYTIQPHPSPEKRVFCQK